MKIKKDKKFIFWTTIIAMICFIGADVFSIIENNYNIIDIILDIVMSLVVLNILRVNCFEKKKK